VAEGEKSAAQSKPGSREYIIVDDEPVRVGENLGDYSLQDAKDILSIRALRDRFAGAGQGRGGSQSGAAEKVSDVLTALAPYLKTEGTDMSTIKEILADKLELQKQEIISRIPQPGQPTEPKSFIEQISGFVAAIGSLKEAGPVLRSILGIPEPSSGNPANGVLPVQITGPDGQPIVMDLGQVINWRKFQGEERRADERQATLSGLAQTARENVPDGIRAILAAVEESKKAAGAAAKTSSAGQAFACADCKTHFSAPPGWEGQPLKCPNPECGREYSKEELLA